MDASRAALLELWLILVLVWVGLGAYSVSFAPLTLAGVTLEKTEIADHLGAAPMNAPAMPEPRPDVRAARASNRLLQSNAPTAAAAAASPRPFASAAPRGATDARKRVNIDAAPQRILMFGDSMIDELMLRMADYAQHNNHKLYPAIWYGSTTGQWASHDKLPSLLAAYDPTFVIVVLGSSELTSRGIGRRRHAVETIKRTLGKRPFVWIGPPNWRGDTGINDLILSVVGKGRFFASKELTFARKRDGIHPTRDASVMWMDRVAAWVARDSVYPIKLALPTKHAPRPRARVFAPQ